MCFNGDWNSYMIFSFDLLVLQTMLFLYMYLCIYPCVCMYVCVRVCMRVKTVFQGLWAVEVGDRAVMKGATRESS